MKKLYSKKKVWTKPSVKTLDIKKDTFGGSGSGPEGAGKYGPPSGPS